MPEPALELGGGFGHELPNLQSILAVWFRHAPVDTQQATNGASPSHHSDNSVPLNYKNEKTTTRLFSVHTRGDMICDILVWPSMATWVKHTHTSMLPPHYPQLIPATRYQRNSQPLPCYTPGRSRALRLKEREQHNVQHNVQNMYRLMDSRSQSSVILRDRHTTLQIQ